MRVDAIAVGDYNRIRVRPATGTIGAEIDQVDLRNLDDETVAELQHAWMQHKVLFFHGQELSRGDHVAYVRNFGELEIHPFVPHVEGHPEMLVLNSTPDSFQAAETWHSDVTFRECPPTGSVLRGRVVPEWGGDTCFANMELAYDVARALATEPDLIVLDEPVSALDVSTQSQVINLLEDLQRETGTAYLFIAHDLAVVRHISDRIAVMYHSRIVERGDADELCEQPTHPYTNLLLASIPDPDPDIQRVKSSRRRELGRGVAGATGGAPTNSCPFAERCPHVMDICHESFPETVPTQAGGEVACHLHTSGPKLGGRPLAEIAAAD